VIAARETGIGVQGGTVSASDLTVVGTEPSSAGFGRGISLETGSRADLSRVLVRDVHEVAILANGTGAEVTGMDITIEDVAGLAEVGRGLMVQAGATLAAERVAVHRVHDIGLGALTDASAVANDIRIVDLRSQGPYATAAGAYHGAMVALDRFRLENAATCGVHVAVDATMDLVDGEVRGCGIGACVQVEDYDLDRLAASTRFIDNGATLDASASLPVPDATGGLPFQMDE
jgi:hypothetical protein